MSALTSNNNYLVTITKGRDVQSVQANAQAKLTLQISNKWVNIMEALGLSGDSAGPVGKLLGNAASAAQIFSGSNFLPVLATTHVWRGSEGIEIALQLRFDAWDDAGKDVLLPVQKLITMFAPTRGNGNLFGAGSILSNLGLNPNIGQMFLHPPGPTPFEYLNGSSGDHTITLGLGRVMNISNLIPTQLSWEFEERYTAEGDPICALVTVGFVTYTLPSQSDIMSYFKRQMVAPTNALAQAPVQNLQTPSPYAPGEIVWGP